MLSGFDGILEVAVIGVPDPKWGEQVTAIIVPKADAPVEAELVAFCRDKITGYKIPRRYLVASELPKSPLGKALKGDLRKNYGQ